FELAADGTIEGTSVAVFSGPFTWSGGAMDSLFGGGKTVFFFSVIVHLPSSTLFPYTTLFRSNYTTAAWSAGQFNAGLNAVWNNQNRSSIHVKSSFVKPYAGGGAHLAFNNSGTLKKSSGAGMATLQIAVNNASLATCQSGTLSL